MCPSGITASVPITWEQARAWIAEGTVESLGRLRRSAAQLAAYRAAMDEVKQEYASVSDYVKASVLGAPMAPNAEGKLEAAEAAAAAAAANGDGNGKSVGRRRLIWRLNDFPYYYEPGIEHHLLWCAEPLPIAEVERLARERFSPLPAADGGGSGIGDATTAKRRREFLIFVNPAPLQSVLAVWHAHVLVRDVPDDAAAA